MIGFADISCFYRPRKSREIGRIMGTVIPLTILTILIAACGNPEPDRGRIEQCRVPGTTKWSVQMPVRGPDNTALVYNHLILIRPGDILVYPGNNRDSGLPKSIGEIGPEGGKVKYGDIDIEVIRNEGGTYLLFENWCP